MSGGSPVEIMWIVLCRDISRESRFNPASLSRIIWRMKILNFYAHVRNYDTIVTSSNNSMCACITTQNYEHDLLRGSPTHLFLFLCCTIDAINSSVIVPVLRDWSSIVQMWDSPWDWESHFLSAFAMLLL